MIDQIYAKVVTRNGIAPDENYHPENVITGEIFTENGSDQLAVVIPPWHRASVQGALTRRLKDTHDTLDYDFHSSILESNHERVRESIEHASNHIAQKISELREANQYKKIHLITMSLGSITLCKVAKLIPDFDTATFVATGDDLASGLWNGIRTWPLREALKDQGMTYPNLQQNWADLSPKNYTDVFAGKSVRFIASSSDTIVPAEDQQSFIDGLIDSGAVVNATHTRLGHLATPGMFCLAGNLDHLS